MMDEALFRTEWGPIFFWSPLLTMLALLVVGLLYFLAPALGYTTYNRGLLLGSLWVLIAKMALMIFKMGILFMEELDGTPSSGKTSQNGPIMTVLFTMLESGMFILAMALFAGGLASLRRDPDGRRPPPHRSFPND
jgi:hypothetical protein